MSLDPLETLQAVAIAFEALNPEHLELKATADAIGKVAPLYTIFFSTGKLTDILTNDLIAHKNELLDPTEKNQHKLAAEDIEHGQLFPTLLKEIEACGGKDTVKKGGTATATWGGIWSTRILRFVANFMLNLRDASRFPTPPASAKAAYKDSIGKFHGFAVSMIVSTAMSLVPGSRDDLIKKFGGNDEALAKLDRAFTAIDKVTTVLEKWLQANVDAKIV
ncbi:hypothetical protein M427DRAFT_57634 [Gonapodya prolifera JEL478]|uniref:Glycolipid transfer protein domain-containing protein n=1 Tax=Gonapodya prolifera (strain JEL478) TaxID=1344416 RepID=A0A139ADD5_GONPJ|nr:hypothetical protein M427DRAFT_57634 [Gonapodya prolifera JEL478]|eukprot:KXS14455.1 hypothetical protein M427DRAFT_57634 [Gonapodya prolifera JEL478]